jgi:hypothetical protein
MEITMVDESVANARAVEEFYKPMSAEESHEFKIKSFIEAARGDMSAKAPFNYGHEGATVCDMMEFALNTKGGVTLASLFAFLAEWSKGDDEAYDMLEKMADQFIWRAF